MRPTRSSASSVATTLSLLASIVLLLVTLVTPTATAARADRTATTGTSSTSTSASRAVRWAPAASAKITPGVQMFTAGAQCTGNFVFTDDAGRVYVGYAAHCAGKGSSTDTDGCSTGSHPVGTRVRFARGATLATDGTTVGRGTLAYSSWVTMHKVGGSGANACAYNDLALVRVDRDDVRKVNPSVPFWGGPRGLSRAGAPATSQVYTWGQSSVRPTSTLSPKTGVSLGRNGGGWSWDVYTASPGIPGDSGSGFLDENGRALGVLSTVAIAPLAGSNGIGDLERELAYARAHSGIAGLRLVPGTRPFRPAP